MLRTLGIIVSMFLSLFSFDSSFAQETTITPTPAPSKTPMPQQIEVLSETPQANVNIDKPFTQADLSVITANTQRPNGMVWHNNNLYTVCSGDWTIYEINAETGETAQYIYGVRNAHSLYANDVNNEFQLWIPDFLTGTLVRIQRGVTENIATGLNGPWGITALQEDMLIVTNLKGNNAVTIKDGQVQEVISNLRSPTGVAVDQERVYIANTGSARRAIEWFSLDQIHREDAELPLQADTVGKPLVSGLQNTTGVVTGSDGLLYFAYALGTRGVVGRVNPETCIANGGCSNDQVEVVLYTELPVPLAGLTISPDMRLYIHSMFSPDLYWVQLPLTKNP